MLARLKRFAQRPSPHVPVTLTFVLLLLFAGGAIAAPKGGGKPSKPTVSISSPSSGSTASGAVTVSGSASAGSTSLASVQVSVDGAAYQRASGTTSWSFPLNTTAYSDGTHTIAAQATDSRGSTAVTSETVTFSNPPAPTPPPPDTTPPSVSISAPAASATVSGTVSVSGSASDNVGVSTVQLSVDGGAYQAAQGTSSWSYSLDTTTLPDGTHTFAARATDTSGNVATASETVTVKNATSTPPPPPPGVTDQLVTPEGLTIQIYSDATGWTAQQIYDLLKPNALELAKIGPTLTVKVQTTYPSSNSVGVSRTNGVYGNFRATIYLNAAAGTVFPVRADDVMAHEYGCVWALYHLYLSHNGDWTPWLQARGILGDTRVDSTFSWSKNEMIADDYRMLFGTAAAQSEAAFINPDVPDPRSVVGLRDFFLNVWAVP
jgi:hypothetical protein